MKVCLIRHGETALTERKCYQGKTDTHLSARGRAELHRLGFSPETVYISPLVRCRETAEIMFPDSRLICAEGLAEMDFGAFEGKNYLDMENDPQYRQWVDGMCEGQCPGGESRASFSERVCNAFMGIISESEKNGEDTVFIVAHGGTQMAVLEKWGYPRKDYYSWCAKPGHGYLLSCRGEAFMLEVIEEI